MGRFARLSQFGTRSGRGIPPGQISWLRGIDEPMAEFRRPVGLEKAACAQHEIDAIRRRDELYSNRESLHLSARYGESGKPRSIHLGRGFFFAFRLLVVASPFQPVLGPCRA